MQPNFDLTTALLDSWDRQAEIIHRIALLINPGIAGQKSSEDGMSLFQQLVHTHMVRCFWLRRYSAEDRERLGPFPEHLLEAAGTQAELDEIRTYLAQSAQAVREATARRLAEPEADSPYDHPILFLQHMIWHEGYHFALIHLALRNAGHEPTEEWEEANVWSQWRTETW